MLKAISPKRIFSHSVLTCFHISLQSCPPPGAIAPHQRAKIQRLPHKGEGGRYQVHLPTGSLGFEQLRTDCSVGNSFTSLFIITYSTLGHICYKKTHTHTIISQATESNPVKLPKAIFRLAGICKEEKWKVSP